MAGKMGNRLPINQHNHLPDWIRTCQKSIRIRPHGTLIRFKNLINLFLYMVKEKILVEDMPITLYRKSIKNVYLRITPPDGEVKLSVPQDRKSVV